MNMLVKREFKSAGHRKHKSITSNDTPPVTTTTKTRRSSILEETKEIQIKTLANHEDSHAVNKKKVAIDENNNQVNEYVTNNDNGMRTSDANFNSTSRNFVHPKSAPIKNGVKPVIPAYDDVLRQSKTNLMGNENYPEYYEETKIQAKYSSGGHQPQNSVMPVYARHSSASSKEDQSHKMVASYETKGIENDALKQAENEALYNLVGGKVTVRQKTDYRFDKRLESQGSILTGRDEKALLIQKREENRAIMREALQKQVEEKKKREEDEKKRNIEYEVKELERFKKDVTPEVRVVTASKRSPKAMSEAAHQPFYFPEIQEPTPKKKNIAEETIPEDEHDQLDDTNKFMKKEELPKQQIIKEKKPATDAKFNELSNVVEHLLEEQRNLKEKINLQQQMIADLSSKKPTNSNLSTNANSSVASGTGAREVRSGTHVRESSSKRIILQGSAEKKKTAEERRLKEKHYIENQKQKAIDDKIEKARLRIEIKKGERSNRNNPSRLRTFNSTKAIENLEIPEARHQQNVERRPQSHIEDSMSTSRRHAEYQNQINPPEDSDEYYQMLQERRNSIVASAPSNVHGYKLQTPLTSKNSVIIKKPGNILASNKVIPFNEKKNLFPSIHMPNNSQHYKLAGEDISINKYKINNNALNENGQYLLQQRDKTLDDAIENFLKPNGKVIFPVKHSDRVQKPRPTISTGSTIMLRSSSQEPVHSGKTNYMENQPDNYPADFQQALDQLSLNIKNSTKNKKGNLDNNGQEGGILSEKYAEQDQLDIFVNQNNLQKNYASGGQLSLMGTQNLAYNFRTIDNNGYVTPVLDSRTSQTTRNNQTRLAAIQHPPSARHGQKNSSPHIVLSPNEYKQPKYSKFGDSKIDLGMNDVALPEQKTPGLGLDMTQKLTFGSSMNPINDSKPIAKIFESIQMEDDDNLNKQNLLSPTKNRFPKEVFSVSRAKTKRKLF